MAPDAVSRRAFLGLAGGVVLLAACGDDAPAEPRVAEFTELAPGVLSSDLYATDAPQRFAFAALAKEGYASVEPARLAVAPPGEEPTRFVATTLRTDGLPERRGIYLADLVLPTAGTWNGVVDFGDTTTDFTFRVLDEAAAPTVGDAAPATASPTKVAPLGVDPLCTREPPCDLHADSIDTLLADRRPLAILFATPARCHSQYCGPVLDTLLPLVDDHPDVAFVHVEIYRGLRTDDLVPTVDAWRLPSEPWLFAVDGDGRVTARLDGAFSTTELRAAIATATA
jgi:hypothetical protein